MQVCICPENETITIGDHIKVTVVKVKRSEVRIGIEAPKEMIIIREAQGDTAKSKKEGFTESL